MLHNAFVSFLVFCLILKIFSLEDVAILDIILVLLNDVIVRVNKLIIKGKQNLLYGNIFNLDW